MTLRLDLFAAAGGPSATLEVPARGWARMSHPDPVALLGALAGQLPAHGRVLLDGGDLTLQPPHDRVHAGLAVCDGQVPDLPGMRVLDVVLLARPAPGRTTSWRAALGSSRARTALADEEAAVRALAGRLGLATWLDVVAVGLPPPVAAATDLARGLAGAPRALVWKEPDSDREALSAILAGEQERLGCAVLSVRRTDDSI